MSERTFEEGKVRLWVIIQLVALGVVAATCILWLKQGDRAPSWILHFTLAWAAWAAVAFWRAVVWWRRAEVDRYLRNAFKFMRERDGE